VTVKVAPPPAPELSKPVPKSPLSPQRPWGNSDLITVKSPTSEPPVLHRIIGQPVVVVPAITDMEEEEALPEETSTEPVIARPTTTPQQRYLLLLGLITAVIVPLCWAGLGAFQQHQNQASIEASQSVSRQSAAATTPILRNPQPEVSAAESDTTDTNTMQPGDLAVPAGSAVPVSDTGIGMPARHGAGNSRLSGSATAVGNTRLASNSASFGNAASSNTTNLHADAGASSGGHEEFPEIPARIRDTIRGHVRVTVRVIVDEAGSVFAAMPDGPAPSHYFERISVEAAKKWTFPPGNSISRVKLVQFDFTRDSTTGQAVSLQ